MAKQDEKIDSTEVKPDQLTPNKTTILVTGTSLPSFAETNRDKHTDIDVRTYVCT